MTIDDATELRLRGAVTIRDLFPNFWLPESGVIWLCPERERDELIDKYGASVEPLIDPGWGLERIIADLAGFPVTDTTPFAVHGGDESPPAGEWS